MKNKIVTRNAIVTIVLYSDNNIKNVGNVMFLFIFIIIKITLTHRYLLEGKV